MQLDSVAALGLQGIQKGLQGARSSAAQIASADSLRGAGTDNLAQPLVALKQHELQVAASAKVIQQADAMIGSLLDTFA